MNATPPPSSIRRAFKTPPGQPVRLGHAWDYGWRIGSVVLQKVTDPQAAGISAQLRENLHPDSLRVAAGIRAADGRLTVTGWRASSFVDGQPDNRPDETAAAALRLDDALAGLAVPAGLATAAQRSPAGVFAAADEAAFNDAPTLAAAPAAPAGAAALRMRGVRRRGTASRRRADEHEMAARLFAEVKKQLPPSTAEVQITHADMLATTIFDGLLPPAVTDIVPVIRPHGYTCALVIVDALVRGITDAGIIDRFSHVPGIDHLIGRALAYRLAVHALVPEPAKTTGEGLQRAYSAVISRMSATL
ncbi:TIGR02569 family protein [Corynebacterium mendelii]|uniref:TIGR02569 family protein n=1 Tax=Corynebacterium mendelii TaxID=2765362 RepID=A0A939E290_9CORY|nr:TIGR02569 family protein [Corynebacterium mendelii]MBN9644448.1 TIGR02569 family protein [Corynebacterium mendelii]